MKWKKVLAQSKTVGLNSPFCRKDTELFQLFCERALSAQKEIRCEGTIAIWVQMKGNSDAPYKILQCNPEGGLFVWGEKGEYNSENIVRRSLEEAFIFPSPDSVFAEDWANYARLLPSLPVGYNKTNGLQMVMLEADGGHIGISCVTDVPNMDKLSADGWTMLEIAAHMVKMFPFDMKLQNSWCVIRKDIQRYANTATLDILNKIETSAHVCFNAGRACPQSIQEWKRWSEGKFGKERKVFD